MPDELLDEVLDEDEVQLFGNDPGSSLADPAKATDSVITVAAIDPKTQLLAEYSSRSGPGGFAVPAPYAPFECITEGS